MHIMMKKLTLIFTVCMLHFVSYAQEQVFTYSNNGTVETKSKFIEPLEKPRDFDPFGQTGFGPFGYNMIDPLKSWCWGSILFYPFKISRFS